MSDPIEEWTAHGLVHQVTDAARLSEHLRSGSRRVYAGFDPTAESLTVGNLVPILMLRRFQLAGHAPVVVMGGATGLVGDPSGKELERPLRDRDEIDRNVAAQRLIFERLLDFEGPAAARILNNADWLEKLSFLDALRDVGKYFSINMMIQKESVRARLEQREQGISYTEFSYVLLQAYDFHHLHAQEGVTVQVGGSDQWGNIVAGVDLVRRRERAECFGLTHPLLTRAEGGKFGKTERGAVWLTRDLTSPYAFYQFWMNVADGDIESYLRLLTLLPSDGIEAALSAHRAQPDARGAQKLLAEEVTRLVHGGEALAHARAASEALFSGQVAGLPESMLDELFAEAPCTEHDKGLLRNPGLPLSDLLLQTTLARSKREAREFLGNGAVSLNGERVGPDDRLSETRLLHGSIALLRRGKKTWHVTRWR
jgi:tyrosyl-tRNA synthetase